ncbi:MAG: hypothetical protein IJ087_19205, partial [Eggerthellaceae bacterium]|nr:hypothetical protein [Eggerthellaceae bacterium]
MKAKSISCKALFVLAATAAALLASLLWAVPQAHAADGVQYLYRSWDSANNQVVTETRTANCVDYNSSMTNLHQG